MRPRSKISANSGSARTELALRGGERAVHNILEVARQGGGGGNTPKLAFRSCAPHRLERAPATERGHQARGDLWISAVEREHRVGNEGVARSVGAVELSLIRLGERADKRS